MPMHLPLTCSSSFPSFAIRSDPPRRLWVSQKRLRPAFHKHKKGFQSPQGPIASCTVPSYACAHKGPENDKARQQLTYEEENVHRCPAYFHSGRDMPPAPPTGEDLQYSALASNSADISNSKTMWAKLGQRFNSAGIISTLRVVFKEQHLALPHLNVPDIRWINWKELKNQGFQGIVFDKDNTLTAPYAPSLWPTLADSLEVCKSVFEGRIALLSNSAGHLLDLLHPRRLPPQQKSAPKQKDGKPSSSADFYSDLVSTNGLRAGLYQYDADGSEAKALEDLIGIPVIRHETKKPAGTAKSIENYFGYDSSLLVMVGDRHFTDIVYGNRNGFLTILTEPLTLAGEPFIVRQIRKLESTLVQCWYRKGFTPARHSLLLSKHEYIKDPDF